MTNHILTLEGLYAGGQREEAEAYGAELKNLLSEMTGEIKSGNPVTDVILQEQKKEAEKRNIRFRTDFYYPKGSRINAFDISVILNNALQMQWKIQMVTNHIYLSIRTTGIMRI